MCFWSNLKDTNLCYTHSWDIDCPGVHNFGFQSCTTLFCFMVAWYSCVLEFPWLKFNLDLPHNVCTLSAPERWPHYTIALHQRMQSYHFCFIRPGNPTEVKYVFCKRELGINFLFMVGATDCSNRKVYSSWRQLSAQSAAKWQRGQSNAVRSC